MRGWLRAWREVREEEARLAAAAPGAAELVQALRHPSGIKSGSLCVYGDIFGGRVDNNHRVVYAELEPDGCALLRFDDHETLRVWDPEGISISAAEFRIERASRVRWEWYSYGDPRTPENLFYQEHRVVGDHVEASSNERRFVSFAPSLKQPAIELLDGLA